MIPVCFSGRKKVCVFLVFFFFKKVSPFKGTNLSFEEEWQKCKRSLP